MVIPSNEYTGSNVLFSSLVIKVLSKKYSLNFISFIEDYFN